MGREILLVDDNVELTENMSEILAQEGFLVTSFNSSRLALEAFVPGRYSIALLDLEMLELDGLALYRRLRARDPSLLAVAITAFASEEQQEAATREGLLEILYKPINISKLLLGLSKSFAWREGASLTKDNAPLR